MADTGTKQRLMDYLQEKTKQVDWEQLSDLSAAAIAEELSLSRTLVSQYLNEAQAEGCVIKVNSRPVYFFYTDALVDATRRETFEGIYDSVDSLRKAIEAEAGNSSVFDKLMGATGSLSYNVLQCKAAISYPGNGLPILLLGATGTGKSYLAQLMYEYAIEKHIIGQDKQFVSVNCAEFANNPEFFLTNLFGFKKGAYTGADKDRKGLLAQADGGMLFLDEVHCLSSECQEKLFHFMDKGVYHMVGDNEKWFQASVHIVMATTENPELVLLSTLLRRIPIITKIASLAERPIQEKKELLFSLIKCEAKRVERKIYLSNLAYQNLLEYEFEGNVGQLVNCIRACIANAYLDSSSDKGSDLKLFIQHLPDYILKNNSIHLVDSDEQNMLSLSDISREMKSKKKLFILNRDILQQFHRIIEEGGNTEDFIAISQTRFEQYLDDLCLDAVLKNNPRESLYSDLIKRICAAVGKRLGIAFSNQDILNLCRLMCDYFLNGTSCENLSRKYYETILIAQELFKKSDTLQNSQIATELIKDIGNSLGKTLSPIGILDLYICVASFTSPIEQRQSIGIILAHGYSTASSMAATANHLLGGHIFDAIDMSSDVRTMVIAHKLSNYMRTLSGVKDVILLVDMGSLEDIYKNIENISNVNLGVIGDVTMKMTLSVGTDIQMGIPIQTILEKQENHPTIHECVFLENRKKQTTILSVCATGMGTAEKISYLLEQSLPSGIDLQVVPYNYGSLASAGIQSPVFEKYNVIFIVGTHDPKVPGCMFISLEDIIQQHNSGDINQMLAKILSKEELRSFNENLIKNFSLTNLVGHLTILNPEKVMDFAENIIKELQVKTGVAFKNKTIVGLYIHICCLVERLITDRYMVTYEHLEKFVKKNEDFIKIVQDSFRDVEKYYGVSIPVAEIGYLYEYIYNL